MGKKEDRRGYRKKGLQFANLNFRTKAERDYVKENTKKLVRRLRELRERQKLSQEKLAELADVSVSTVKFIEQDQRAPSLPMFFKILYALDRQADVWK